VKRIFQPMRFLLALVLASCSVSGYVVPAAHDQALTVAARARLSGSLTSEPAASADAKGEYLYVGNGGKAGVPATITVYAPGSSKSIRTIASPEGSSPLAFDRSGNLYVGLGCSISVYGPKDVTPKRTITDGLSNVTFLAFDRFDTLYVSNLGEEFSCNLRGSLTEYPRGSSIPTLTIPESGNYYPVNVAFDSYDNAYVATVERTRSGGFVAVYARGTIAPSRRIRDAKGGTPIDVAVDRSNRIYVGYDSHPSEIEIYHLRATMPQRTIVLSSTLIAFAIASDGTLYALEFLPGPSARGFVDVYAPGKTQPERRIIQDIQSPNAIALDKSGNLYVANAGNQRGSVTEYPPGGITPIRKITDEIINPVALVLSSQ
jgi:hypothetical protein